MEQLEYITTRRRSGGVSLRDLIKVEQHVAACYLCRKYHPLRCGNEQQDYEDFSFRHPIEKGCIVTRLNPDQLRIMVNRAQQRRKLRHDSILEFTHNASVLEAFQASDQSLDLTSLNSLASSATAGWSSQAVDNSANLYLDYLFALKLGTGGTAGSNKAIYVFAASSLNTTDLPNTGASSGVVTSSTTTAAALTFPSISTPLPCAFPMARVIPYPVNSQAVQSPVFSIAKCFGGFLGLYLWVPVLNFSGWTFAGSGNSFKYRGVYNTVA